jgi:hypothetical protein
MAWYEVVAHFFAAAFLTNAVPHFVQGVTGNRFPSVFAPPPRSSGPLANVIWAGINIAIALLLLHLVPVPDPWPRASEIAMTIGVAVTAIGLAVYFGRWRREHGG